MTYGIINNIKYAEYNPRWQLIGIIAKVGAYVDSISWIFNNIDTGENYTTSKQGGTGGNPVTWIVPSGKRITHVYVKVGVTYINSIQFQYGTGSFTPVFGGAEGTMYDLDCTTKRVVGAKVTTGSYLTSMAFLLEPL